MGFRDLGHGKNPQLRSWGACCSDREEEVDLGNLGVAGSDAIANSLGIETRDYSRGFIPRKIDLLRRGDVPLRGGVFGVQKTPSHKP